MLGVSANASLNFSLKVQYGAYKTVNVQYGTYKTVTALYDSIQGRQGHLYDSHIRQSMPCMVQCGIHKTDMAFSLGVSYVSANASLNVSLKVQHGTHKTVNVQYGKY